MLKYFQKISDSYFGSFDNSDSSWSRKKVIATFLITFLVVPTILKWLKNVDFKNDFSQFQFVLITVLTFAGTLLGINSWQTIQVANAANPIKTTSQTTTVETPVKVATQTTEVKEPANAPNQEGK